MSHGRNETIHIVPTTSLLYRYEIEVNLLSEELAYLIDLEQHLGLFFTTVLDPNQPWLDEKIIDFECDIMMYVDDRDIAIDLFKRLVRRTIEHIHRTTGVRYQNFGTQWRWHNYQHRAVLLRQLL